MKLKRKLILSSSLVLVVAAPVATAISCSDNDWSETDSNIDNSSIKIDLEKELILSGKDGEGKMKLQLGEGLVGMLLQAHAELKLEVARYKESTKDKKNFQEVMAIDFAELEKNKTTFEQKMKIINDKLKVVSDLMVEDVVRAVVTSTRKTFPIKESKDLIVTDKSLEYHPLDPSISMTDASTIIPTKPGTLEFDLSKFNKKNSINDVIFSLAKGMGMLMSTESDVTLGNKTPGKSFTPKMLFDMLKNMHSKNIQHIDFITKDEDGKEVKQTFDLFKKDSQTIPVKDQLDETVQEFQTIFDAAKNAGKTIEAGDDIDKVSVEIKTKLSQSGIAERYKELFTESQTNLMLLVANIHKAKPTTTPKTGVTVNPATPKTVTPKADELIALEKLLGVAMAYSNVFRRLKECDFFKGWVETTRLRNIDKLDQILFSTILRNK